MMIDLTGDRPEVAEYVDVGRVYLDGSVLIGAMDGVVRDRIRLALNGHAMVSVILDENDDPLGDAWVELMGLPEIGRSEKPLADLMETELTEVLGSAPAKVMRDDDKLEETVRRIIRQVAVEEIGKKPEVTVVVSRLAEE
jgi:ribonuclease J